MLSQHHVMIQFKNSLHDCQHLNGNRNELADVMGSLGLGLPGDVLC